MCKSYNYIGIWSPWPGSSAPTNAAPVTAAAPSRTTRRKTQRGKEDRSRSKEEESRTPPHEARTQGRKDSRSIPTEGHKTKHHETKRNAAPVTAAAVDLHRMRREAGEGGREEGNESKLHYLSRYFMPDPEPRPAEPATRAAVDRLSRSKKKALVSIPLLWSMGNWKQSTHICTHTTDGGRFIFSESSETWKPGLVPPPSPQKIFHHSNPTTTP